MAASSLTHQLVSSGFVPAADGSIDGWEAVCSCNFSRTHSLSERSARQLIADHVVYMNRKVQGKARR
jgi:hypothetical protein